MNQLFSSGLRIVGFYAAACVAIYLLQLFPVTGLFLMFFFGPIWIGVLIHIMMVHVGVASGVAHISRWWLAIPLFYYIGGFVLHLYSERKAHVAAQEIEAANAAAKTPVEHPFIYMFRYSHETTFFERCGADRAFITESNQEFGQYDFAQGSACNATTRWNYKNRYEPYMRRADLFPAYKGADKVLQCIITKNVKSAEWRYRLETKQIAWKGLLNPSTWMIEWRMIDGTTGAAVATVRTASIGMLPPIQTFVAGCGLNSGAARWDCAAGLLSSSAHVVSGYKPRPPGGNPFTPSNDPDTWPESTLCRALSLEPRRPNG